MAKYLRKALDKLDARIRGYQEMCAIAEKRRPGSSKGYTRPGRRNKEGK